MFFSFGNIKAAKARHAENADTRQAIRQQEREGRRRGNTKKEGEAAPAESADNTVVSISALKAFLENFLKSLPSDTAPEDQKNIIKNNEALNETALEMGRAFNKKRPVAGKTAKALGAYQSAAQNKKSEQSFSAKDTKETAENLGLHPSEIRTIHALIEDLNILSKNNIETLTLEADSSFLQSLVKATARALAQAKR